MRLSLYGKFFLKHLLLLLLLQKQEKNNNGIDKQYRLLFFLQMQIKRINKELLNNTNTQ